MSTVITRSNLLKISTMAVDQSFTVANKKYYFYSELFICDFYNKQSYVCGFRNLNRTIPGWLNYRF